MGMGTSLFLVAVGAIMRFAIDVTTKGVDVHMIGVILMFVGAFGVVLSAVFWSTWGGFNRPAGATRASGDTVVVERETRL